MYISREALLKDPRVQKTIKKISEARSSVKEKPGIN